MRQINRDHGNQDDNKVSSDTPSQRSQATTIKKSTFKKKVCIQLLTLRWAIFFFKFSPTWLLSWEEVRRWVWNEYAVTLLKSRQKEFEPWPSKKMERKMERKKNVKSKKCIPFSINIVKMTIQCNLYQITNDIFH